MLKRFTPRICKMTYIIGRRFVECQILKKWKWPYLLNWVADFDKLLRKHWYWQGLAQEIANWHFLLVEALASSKFWKVQMALSLELWRTLWWNFAYTLVLTRCSQMRYVKWHLGLVEVLPRFKFWQMWNLPYLLNLLVYFDEILYTHYYWHNLDRGIAKSSPRVCKLTFNIGGGCAELQILKKWKWPNWVDYCDETLHTHWYCQDVTQEIVKCHLGLAEVLPRFRFWKTVKLALSLEAFKYFDKIMNKHCYWRELDRRIVKCHLLSVEAMPRSKS